MAGLRVAIVHDWLVSMRGGERVLESLCRLYPRAHLFTLRFERGGVSPEIAGRAVTPSFVDRLARALPLGHAEFRWLLPLFPLAVRSFRLDGYDLVVSSSHAVAKGARAAPGALHVAYLHSPMRYVWEAQAAYAASLPGGALGRTAFDLLARGLRRWDVASTAGAHALVANSRYTRDRIRRYYGREATVIEPPVDARRFARVPDRPPAGGAPTYLCVSALVPYKRVELAVRAFVGRRARLVIVGDGPERARLAALAGPNVELRGRVADAELDRLYAAADAVIHPAVDDFGIVPVEALAAGRPVVAFAEGGARDTVREPETGTLFAEPTAAALGAAITRLEQLRFDPVRLRAAARRFDQAEFERRFGAFVEERLERRGGAAVEDRPGGAAVEERPGAAVVEEGPGGAAVEERPGRRGGEGASA
jgi:glycosyltransferase involved in cell wall biosynthesis